MQNLKVTIHILDIQNGMEFCLFVLNILSGNPDLVNINAYTAFIEIMSICSKDIEQKHNSKINQGP